MLCGDACRFSPPLALPPGVPPSPSSSSSQLVFCNSALLRPVTSVLE